MAIQPQEIPFEEPAEEPPLEPNRFSEPGPPETPPRPAEPQPDLCPPECPPEREPRECLIPALVASRPRQTASGLFIPEFQETLPFESRSAGAGPGEIISCRSAGRLESERRP
jgi:hypothetical protein